MNIADKEQNELHRMYWESDPSLGRWRWHLALLLLSHAEKRGIAMPETYTELNFADIDRTMGSIISDREDPEDESAWWETYDEDIVKYDSGDATTFVEYLSEEDLVTAIHRVSSEIVFNESIGEGYDCEYCGWSIDRVEVTLKQNGECEAAISYGCYSGDSCYGTREEVIEFLRDFYSGDKKGMKDAKHLIQNLKEVAWSIPENIELP